MESHNTSCSICLMSYNEAERRPLVLPCSHSFCQACLEHLERDDNKTCSYCRKYWGNSKVRDLICCLQLLPDEDTKVNKDQRVTQKCKEHDAELSMRCKSCSENICVKCLSLKHKKCNWMLLEEEQENSTAVYEIAVSHLVEMASRSGSVIDSLDSFESELQNFRDKLRTWQKEMEYELAECPMFQAEAGATQDRTEFQGKLNVLVTKQLELSDTADSFLSCLEERCQVAEYGTGKSLRAQLQSLTETTLLKEVCSPNTNSRTNNQAASVSMDEKWFHTSHTDQTSIVEALDTLSYESFSFRSFFSAGDSVSEDREISALPVSSEDNLVIRDTSEIPKVYSYLQSSAKYKFVIMEGSSWKERQFTDVLSVVSNSSCQISVKTLDTFWQPSPSGSSTRSATSFPFSKSTSADGNCFSSKPQSRSIFSTRARLDSLLKPGFRCVLTEFWGHLDADGLKKLPNSLRTLGLALADKEDLATLRLVIDMDGGKWSLKKDWHRLWKLHLSFPRSLRAKDFKGDKKAKELSSVASKTPVRRLPDVVALHFTNVDAASLEWMQDIMLLFAKKCFVTEVFLPDAWFTPYFGMAAFKDDSISKVVVHLPLDLKIAGSPSTLGGCPIQWDL